MQCTCTCISIQDGSGRPRKDIKNMLLGMGGGAKKKRKSQGPSGSVKNDSVLNSIMESIHKVRVTLT